MASAAVWHGQEHEVARVEHRVVVAVKARVGGAGGRDTPATTGVPASSLDVTTRRSRSGWHRTRA